MQSISTIDVIDLTHQPMRSIRFINRRNQSCRDSSTLPIQPTPRTTTTHTGTNPTCT
jgi:hypothetical protein